MKTLALLVSLVAVLCGVSSRASEEIVEFPLATEGHRPQALTIGPDGNLWVTEVLKHKILKLTLKGEFTEYAVPAKEAGVLQGIAAGSDGNLYFSSRDENMIRRMTPAGEFN